MNYLLEIYGLVAICAAAMAVTRTIAVHGLLYMVVSLIALACVFDQLGAPLAAMLEIVVYAGAVMVLFIFVVMMVNLGQSDQQREKAWLAPHVWAGPGGLAALLMIVLVTSFHRMSAADRSVITDTHVIGPDLVAHSLYRPYLLTVELASFLLLAGLVSAYHIGRRIGKDS
ncbi:NADH-quinone oxidoreductase subunit J [Candidatus Kirkpatrickella diaphorinae]|uniref:NADH-quinone oxidoreductase subunit J n=1 Tax=Candidatus Kirkpatrickella diaphorinae TaxID=2984322 RepID=A0ABY6GI82_9PROT|nr:NADH-quinone oxidoreductase subunit J [Candidatus Kirkpatrickella diaphorinae]UYH51214.1 NADH-quinone oxidoreductase subunit J [Candidatus Kirkpatrickella diaphorinae]